MVRGFTGTPSANHNEIHESTGQPDLEHGGNRLPKKPARAVSFILRGPKSIHNGECRAARKGRASSRLPLKGGGSISNAVALASIQAGCGVLAYGQRLPLQLQALSLQLCMIMDFRGSKLGTTRKPAIVRRGAVKIRALKQLFTLMASACAEVARMMILCCRLPPAPIAPAGDGAACGFGSEDHRSSSSSSS
ncbi:hypothetical protein DM860_006271 [Cuscuta australis]|uniref:Uncharacterized protein n=1 Tax=Cuscuta australis TaxID=267555 RepID=A0A328DKE0_9ASTE|nr:hypothetical protein DM860_006271 [Cuscuta australis]